MRKTAETVRWIDCSLLNSPDSLTGKCPTHFTRVFCSVMVEHAPISMRVPVQVCGSGPSRTRPIQHVFTVKYGQVGVPVRRQSSRVPTPSHTYIRYILYNRQYTGDLVGCHSWILIDHSLLGFAFSATFCTHHHLILRSDREEDGILLSLKHLRSKGLIQHML